ncbi:hypothetical protein AAFC00_002103 [Neodothiora populina]|uniref:Uncharacterized protein n=1 Tax=Neodothiora populina TaxID=2781224 RepID=A0ABR3PGK6_9PEZI
MEPLKLAQDAASATVNTVQGGFLALSSSADTISKQLLPSSGTVNSVGEQIGSPFSTASYSSPSPSSTLFPATNSTRPVPTFGLYVLDVV